MIHDFSGQHIRVLHESFTFFVIIAYSRYPFPFSSIKLLVIVIGINVRSSSTDQSFVFQRAYLVKKQLCYLIKTLDLMYSTYLYINILEYLVYPKVRILNLSPVEKDIYFEIYKLIDYFFFEQVQLNLLRQVTRNILFL